VRVREAKFESEEGDGRFSHKKKGGKFRGRKSASKKPWEKGPTGKVSKILKRVNTTVLTSSVIVKMYQVEPKVVRVL